MKKRQIPCSYFEDAATLEAKRQRESAERQKRYLIREKQKATALMRKRRRVRLALQGFVDVFSVLPRSDLNSLEISCSTFHSIVSIHMNDVCLISVGFVRAEQQLGYIFIDGEAKFRAIDEGHTDAAPVGQKHFRANVYVLLQRIVSKCFVKKMWINDLAHLDDVAFKALIAIQPNVGNVTLVCTYGVGSYAHNVSPDMIRSALFGFQSAGVTSFRAPYEVFTRHAVKRTKEDGAFKLMLDAPVDQDRYHDEDLISLFSIESRYTHISIHFQGLRLSSAFVLSIIEAHTTNVLSAYLSFFIEDSKMDEQERGTHSFAEDGSSAELVLLDIPHLSIRVNLDTDNITIFRY